MKVQRLRPSAVFPVRATEKSVGLDLHADLDAPLTISPGKWEVVPTGLAFNLENCEGQIRPRSGLAAKFGVTVLNSPGTIDPDYRGEVKVILINFGPSDFVVNPGDRIAQLVVLPRWRVWVDEVEALDDTDRGSGGFGSTGR